MKILPAALRHHALYPERYAWFVLTSTLDIILTHSILHHFADFGGRELNTVADWVIGRFDIWGAIGLKFLTVIVVIATCEIVGRRRPGVGSGLATTVLVLSLLPPGIALAQLAMFASNGG
jgi:hypothetical protein